ncbi:MAG: hypothetical protein KIT14_06785 [bacterium]|nr:hypothetical protein [bacterium]
MPARRRAPWLLAALVMLHAVHASAQRPGADERPLGLGVSPIGDKVKVRVGSVERFRVEALGTDVQHRWTLDGHAVGSAAQWSFAPAAADVGLHRIVVTVTAREGTVSRAWSVRVLPPKAPELVDASPRETTLEVPARTWLRFQIRIRTTPAASLEEVAVAWSVDGVAAGEGETLRWRPPQPGSYRVRALATSSLGSAVAREWRVDATVPPPTTTTAPLPITTTTRAPMATTTAPRATTSSTTEPWPTTTTSTAPLPVTTSTTAPPPVPPTTVAPPPASGPGDAEIRALLDRYAAAWGRGDVDELRRLGQVTNDQQAAALRAYFAKTGSIEVRIELLAVVRDGGRTVVRFRRRDRFRNPAGGVVDEASPPLEKDVVEEPDGLRFGRAR